MKGRDVNIEFKLSDGKTQSVGFRVRDGEGQFEKWLTIPGNEGKSREDYIESLRGIKGTDLTSIETEVTEIVEQIKTDYQATNIEDWNWYGDSTLLSFDLIKVNSDAGPIPESGKAIVTYEDSEGKEIEKEVDYFTGPSQTPGATGLALGGLLITPEKLTVCEVSFDFGSLNVNAPNQFTAYPKQSVEGKVALGDIQVIKQPDVTKKINGEFKVLLYATEGNQEPEWVYALADTAVVGTGKSNGITLPPSSYRSGYLSGPIPYPIVEGDEYQFSVGIQDQFTNAIIDKKVKLDPIK